MSLKRPSYAFRMVFFVDKYKDISGLEFLKNAGVELLQIENLTNEEY